MMTACMTTNVYSLINRTLSDHTMHNHMYQLYIIHTTIQFVIHQLVPLNASYKINFSHNNYQYHQAVASFPGSSAPECEH